ncbi:unnamed protein product, partial [marine sediment metagenome]
MPWTVGDVDDHMKGLSASEKETWVEVANKALAACEKAGKADCDASAIKQANAVLGKVREALTPDEEDFVEAASFKAILQRFMKAAGVLAGHPFISKGAKKRLSGLQDTLRTDHGKAAGEESDDTSEAGSDPSPGGEAEFK